MSDEAQKPTHTPAPWKVACDTYVCAGTNYIADVGLDNDVPEEEIRANVHLIAAAPELLAALELLLSPFGHLSGCLWLNDKRSPCQCDPRGRAATAANQARAAIAKAKGESK